MRRNRIIASRSGGVHNAVTKSLTQNSLEYCYIDYFINFRKTKDLDHLWPEETDHT